MTITLVFGVAHVGVSYLKHYTDMYLTNPAVLTLFDMDAEVSIPTWYAQSLLLIVAVICLVIGVVKRQSVQKYYKHWLALGIIFIYVSMDEGSQIHELLIPPLQATFNTSGTFLHFAWVIAGASLMAVLGVIYLRFWLNLPSRTRVLFLASAAIFVSGALGIEMMAGYYLSNYGSNIGYSILVLIEESMELLGSSLFIYTLLNYLRYLKPDILLQFKNTPTSK